MSRDFEYTHVGTGLHKWVEKLAKTYTTCVAKRISINVSNKLFTFIENIIFLMVCCSPAMPFASHLLPAKLQHGPTYQLTFAAFVFGIMKYKHFWIMCINFAWKEKWPALKSPMSKMLLFHYTNDKSKYHNSKKNKKGVAPSFLECQMTKEIYYHILSWCFANGQMKY